MLRAMALLHTSLRMLKLEKTVTHEIPGGWTLDKLLAWFSQTHVWDFW